MKILYMSERFAPFIGGIETMSEHLLRALAQQGHEIQVVTSHAAADLPDRDDWNGIAVHRLHMLTSLSRRDVRGILKARAALRAIKRDFAPDVAHLQFSGPSPTFHWDTQDGGVVPTLVTVHSVAGKMVRDRSIYLDTLERADWVAPVSRHMLALTLAHAPHIAGKASVVYNGLPAEQIRDSISPPDFSAPMILWIGRMVAWKRVDRVIDAMAQLAPEHPDLRLVLAGDGPTRAALEAQVVAAGLGDRVTFTGWVDADRRAELLRAATVVAIPSESEENLPMAALEAASIGRVIVGAAVSGLPEIVELGQSGVLVTDIDAPRLAAAIAMLLADPARIIAMGQRASDLVRERFREDLMIDAYIRLYHQIAVQRSHP